MAHNSRITHRIIGTLRSSNHADIFRQLKNVRNETKTRAASHDDHQPTIGMHNQNEQILQRQYPYISSSIVHQAQSQQHQYLTTFLKFFSLLSHCQQYISHNQQFLPSLPTITINHFIRSQFTRAQQFPQYALHMSN